MDNSIIYEKDGNTVEEVLMTYSEEDRQNAEINRGNANLVFSPKFIPYYPEVAIKFSLTPIETLLFGFIDFYKSNSSNRFYFTNDQLAEVLNCNPDTISRAISKIQKLNLIKTSHRIKAGGGTIRFVTDIIYNVDSTKTTSHTRQKLQTNNNKINNNKINIQKKISDKKKFLDFVFLSDNELEKIHDLYGIALTERYIESLNNYIGSRGKKYKSHYHTLLQWMKDEQKKEKLILKTNDRNTTPDNPMAK